MGYLLQNPFVEGAVDLLRVRRQPAGSDLPQGQQIVRLDVRALVFGERVKEHGAGAGPVGDQRAVAARAALSFPSDPLLDDAAAKIGVDQATGGARYGLAQAPIRNPLAARVPHQPFGFEDSHAIPNSINYST
jgi:hypothetical protein